MWNSFGDYVINRTKGNFGTKDQGAFRISPILNPLYLSYSGRRGVTYKLKLNGSYKFSLNRDISIEFKAGYSFKQNQFYFNIPIRFNFNKRRNGYIGLDIGNGNRITNSSIVDQIKHESLDSIDWDKLELDYFKDFYVKFMVNYDLSNKWSVKPGMIYHRRSAVNEAGFVAANRPTTYYSFAPSLEIQFRPSGWSGPIITADYERGVRIGSADMDYERFEFDVSWKKNFYSLRSMSLRLGSGFYTSKAEIHTSLTIQISGTRTSPGVGMMIGLENSSCLTATGTTCLNIMSVPTQLTNPLSWFFTYPIYRETDGNGTYIHKCLVC